MIKALLLVTLTAASLAGHWEGGVERLGSVQPLAVDLRAGSGGKLSGTYDIPELGLYAQPITDISFDGTALSLHVLYGKFALAPNEAADEMTGANMRWKPPLDLHLKRTMPVATYRSTDLTVRNKAIRLAGTLYQPLATGRAPLLVIIPGSNNDGRAAFEYRGYGPMLAQQGIAAFVYDKRGTGFSSGSQRARFSDYASDANAIVNELRARPGIDSARVGLGGASQGGWIAPLAASTNPNVRFLVLFAGPAVSVQQQEIDRVSAAMREQSASAADMQEAISFTRAYFDVALNRAPFSALQERFDALEREQPQWLDVLSLPDPGESLANAVADWKRILYDPKAVLQKTKIPVLALFGAADDLVTPDDNVRLMREYLSTNNAHDSIVLLAGASHGFFTGQTLVGGEWDWPAKYWHWDRRAAQLLPTMVTWIDALRN